MTSATWIGLTGTEVELIERALTALLSAAPDRSDEIECLRIRLSEVVTPSITVGVYGGAVQWVRGNPFPIRIIDYDGDDHDLPDRDDEGSPCSLWNVGGDPALALGQG